MDIGEQISKLAEGYDPDKEADGLAVRAFMQGWMCMMVAQESNQQTTVMKDVVNIKNVEQFKDANGDYEHHFTVVTGSGHRIKVKLELEE